MRNSSRIFKSVDLWNCFGKNEGNKKGTNPNLSLSPRKIRKKAPLDDAIFVESTHKVLIRLIDGSLMNLHLGKENVEKVYRYEPQISSNLSGLPNPIATSWGTLFFFPFFFLLPKRRTLYPRVDTQIGIRKRRICSMDEWGLDNVVISGGGPCNIPEMIGVDMSPEMDHFEKEKERKKKRYELGLPLKSSLDSKDTSISSLSFQSAGSVKGGNRALQLKKVESYYGKAFNVGLEYSLTSCDSHSDLPFIVCGTTGNTFEIFALESRPDENDGKAFRRKMGLFEERSGVSTVSS